MQQRVLVACEKGSLAFDLTDHLLREGRKVIIVGELLMDQSRNLKTLNNLFNLELTKHSPLHPLSNMNNIHQMYHLACPTRDQYEEDPVQALESCFMGTKNLLDVALRCNARVVLGSNLNWKPSSTEQPAHALWDDRLRRKRKRSSDATEVVKPATKRRRTQARSVPSVVRSFYDEGNRLAEMLCSAYEQHFGLEVRIAPFPEARPMSKRNSGGGRTLELIASAEESPEDSADITLIEPAAEDGIVRGLFDLMEAPSPAKAANHEAGQSEASVPVA